MQKNNGHKVRHSSFIDLSDYARPIAVWIALQLKTTRIQVYQITLLHFFLMVIAAALIAVGGLSNILIASLLILLKNIFDAVDGSLARIRNRPSRVGRFLDSNLDFVGNLFLFLSVTYVPLWIRVFGFLSFVIQGSFFNFYYILFRNTNHGDTTSKVNEDDQSNYSYDNRFILKILYFFYKIFYKWQDAFVLIADRVIGKRGRTIPAVFVSFLSVNGLGFQYLIFILLLSLHQQIILFLWFTIFMNIYLVILLAYFRFFIRSYSQCRRGKEYSKVSKEYIQHI